MNKNNDIKKWKDNADFVVICSNIIIYFKHFKVLHPPLLTSFASSLIDKFCILPYWQVLHPPLLTSFASSFIDKFCILPYWQVLHPPFKCCILPYWQVLHPPLLKKRHCVNPAIKKQQISKGSQLQKIISIVRKKIVVLKLVESRVHAC